MLERRGRLSAWGRSFLARLESAAADMGCFCAVPEEFYCEVLLLDESKLTLTTQQQGIKVGTGRGRVRGFGSRAGSGGGGSPALGGVSGRAVGRSLSWPLRAGRGRTCRGGFTLSPFLKESKFDGSKDSPRTNSQLQSTVLQRRPEIFSTLASS